MVYYNPATETELTVDASPVGLGAMLTQKSPNPNGSEEVRIVTYASRVLTDVEKRYSQTEKDLPLYGDVRNFMYTCICMAQPLTSLPTTRPSKSSSAILNQSLLPELNGGFYACSSMTLPSHTAPEMEIQLIICHDIRNLIVFVYKEEYICYVAMYTVPKAMTLEEIISATQSDPTLQAVKVCLQSGTWHTSKHLFPNANHNDLNSFEKLKTELTEPSAGLMLRGIRYVIPQTRSVQLAHEGHQGILKTKTAKMSGSQKSMDK
ncbi:Hypothetical predicted protein [Paramuricea clavata]|uniref:Uncharacterized protein n=1 Tax=Paramuricea clavata TaxID=317549 RepID=A0A7D9K2Q5_PARCT|nr:Hypothetical predicted protein [Paramuricea clavata]